MNRATFVSRMGGAFALALFDSSGMARLLPNGTALEHPEPREGITAEHVLSAEAIGEKLYAKKHVAASYEAARAHPELFDGIACACSCGGKKGTHRSLLSCFESMQPTGCGACQEEGELVGKLAADGKSLGDIRAAVDKQFD